MERTSRWRFAPLPNPRNRDRPGAKSFATWLARWTDCRPIWPKITTITSMARRRALTNDEPGLLRRYVRASGDAEPVGRAPSPGDGLVQRIAPPACHHRMDFNGTG